MTGTIVWEASLSMKLVIAIEARPAVEELRRLAGRERCLEVHIVTSFQDAIDRCRLERPDVVLVDERLIDEPAARVRDLLEVASATRVLAYVSGGWGRVTTDAFLEAGGAGLIQESCPPRVVLAAVQCAATPGVVVFTPEMSEGRAGVDPGSDVRDLIHVLSDELLTPATVLQGVAQTIAARPDLSPERARELAEGAQRASARLRRIAENISLASRIRSDSLQLRSAPVSVAELLDRVASAFPDEDRLRLRGPEGGLDQRFTGDFDLASHAVIAVTENALEFSEGLVEIAVTSTADHVVLSVRDEGTGIPEALRPRAFELFVQGESSDTRPSRGMGLGLYLAQGILRAHGGELDVTTAAGANVLVLRFPVR